MRRHSTTLAQLFGGLLMLLAFALPAEELSPETLVRQTSDRMLSLLKENRAMVEADSRKLYSLVDDVVLPHFDFTRMARWVLGKYWRRATDEQREKFVTEFRNLLVRTYGTVLLEYTDQTINYLAPRHSASGTEVNIRTIITDKRSKRIPIDYAMYMRENAWKVYDVRVNGVSLVANYRTSFADQIRQDGLDRLIENLTQRNHKSKT